MNWLNNIIIVIILNNINISLKLFNFLYLHQCFLVLVYKSYTSFNLFPIIFFIYDFGNEIVIKIFRLQECDLFLWNEFGSTRHDELINSKSCKMDFLKFSVGKIKLPENRNNVTPSFSILMPFISFSCLIVLARTNNIVSKRNGSRFLLMRNHPVFYH